MLERAEYAMTSMQDVRRLIRNHGWAVLVVGRSGDLQAAHVPCLLDPVHDARGAAE
jgi:predicted FMN-binding regulatory protein PaiB